MNNIKGSRKPRTKSKPHTSYGKTLECGIYEYRDCGCVISIYEILEETTFYTLVSCDEECRMSWSFREHKGKVMSKPTGYFRDDLKRKIIKRMPKLKEILVKEKM